MNWYIKVLKNYAVFTGRARRQEYWFFFLFNFIAFILLMVIDSILWGGTETFTFNFDSNDSDFHWASSFNDGWDILSSIYAIGMIIPSIAVTVRRLHDTNHRGWWYLLLFIPVSGWITIFVFTVVDGDSGKNRFGSDPEKESPPPGLFDNYSAKPAAKPKAKTTRK